MTLPRRPDAPPTVHLLSVFAAGPGGGNPAPVVSDAAGMSDGDMQGVARAYGHESGFVLPPPSGSDCDFALRFWVPNHEMEMCGHATVGAVWLLGRLGRLPRDSVALQTRSGRVDAQVTGRGTAEMRVETSQPRGQVEPLPDAGQAGALLSVLGISSDELASQPIRNACTSRVKTLIPLKSAAVLDGLRPDYGRVGGVCERIGSTGLYPFAPADDGAWDARQFPKSSGYPEEAATGIAAAALAFGLLEGGLVGAGNGRPVLVRQGRAMGRPSEIAVRFQRDGAGQVQGCWLGGAVRMEVEAGSPPAG